MIGQKEVLEYLMAGGQVRSVFLLVGEKPEWFDPKNQEDMSMPMIYTEKRNPQPIDLKFLEGQNIQLIHAKNASDELFAAWYIHTHQLKAKTLVALDSAGDIYV
jgi:hypothetical protein